jgi:hypothetical protein
MVMKWLFKTWSFIAHPLFIPLLLSIWYYNYAGFLGTANTTMKLYLIAVLTIAIPLLTITVLRVLKVAESIHLVHVQERVIPLIVYAMLLILVVRGVFNNSMNTPLYYFYVGTLMSTIVALILALFKFKISLHMLAVSSMLGFVVILSFILGIFMIYQIAFLCIVVGLTATSRMFLKAHHPVELILGTVIGLVVQLSLGAYYHI